MVQKKAVYYLFTAIIVLYLILASCHSDQEGKIPVTTSSPEALKWYSTGLELYDNLRNQEANEYFKKALERDSDFALAHLNYGATARDLKIFFTSMKKALSLLDKISEGERLMILGAQAGADGLSMKQREYYQQLVENYPQDERAHYLLGNYYYFQQDFNLAIGEYRRATEINSDYPPAYNMLGYAHRQLENFEEAEEAFKKYIKIIPDHPNPYDSYAELLLKKGEFEKSIETYQKALKIEPNFYPSWIGIATNLNFLDRHQEARSTLWEFKQRAQTSDERRVALNAIMISYIDEDNYPRALDISDSLLNMSIQIADTASMASDYEVRGSIFLELGRLAEAQQNFQQSLNIIKQSNLSAEFKANVNTIALYHSARINIEKDQLAAAKILTEELGRKAESKKNRFQSWLYHELLGLIALEEKNYDEALGEFRRANLEDPYNLYRMSVAHQAKGDLTQAIKFCEKVISFHGLNSLSYSFVRNKALFLLDQLKK